MNFIINNCTVVDQHSIHNGKICNLLIENGLIKKISYEKISTPSTTPILDLEGKMLSPGWVDMNTSCAETGNEWDENITSLLDSAANGGFTEILLMPNTNPILDNTNNLNNLKNYLKNSKSIVDAHPVCALTRELKGKELAELYDMSQKGAIAFSNGLNWINDSNLMLQVLKYCKMLNKPIISIAQDYSLSNSPIVNESLNTLQLGFKGTPYTIESLALRRDIELIKYTHTKLHFGCISTKEAVDIIKDAKKSKLNISADTTSYLLCLDDSYLNDFDTNYKVNPPLRSLDDIKSLKKALKENVIDSIVSQHVSLRQEEKVIEFELAAYGINNLETSFACINESLTQYMDIAAIITKITYEPRKILNLNQISVSEGSHANLTLFDINKYYKFEAKLMKSKGYNNPFINKTIQGKSIGVINNNGLIITDTNYMLK